MPTINTRIPEQFSDAPGVGQGVYAWRRDDDGNLIPTGNTGLTAGQAWEYSGSDLVPTGDAITDDPYWESAGGSDIRPA